MLSNSELKEVMEKTGASNSSALSEDSKAVLNSKSMSTTKGSEPTESLTQMLQRQFSPSANMNYLNEKGWSKAITDTNAIQGVLATGDYFSNTLGNVFNTGSGKEFKPTTHGNPEDSTYQGVQSFIPKAADAALIGATGGAGGLGVKVAGSAAKKGAEDMFFKMMKGELSDEQLTANVRAAKGTETMLGEVLQNPYLKHFEENTLTALPFTEANKTLQRTGQQVTDKGLGLLKEMSGGDVPTHENISLSLQKMAKDSIKSSESMKREVFKDVNKQADKENFRVNLDLFPKEARSILKQMDLDSDLKQKIPSGVISEIKRYTSGDVPISKEIKVPLESDFGRAQLFGNQKTRNSSIEEPPPGKTLQQADLLKGEIGNQAYNYSRPGESQSDYLSGVYTRLKEALDGDINNSVAKSGSKDLKTKRDAAFKYYEENIVPLRTKEIKKYSRQGGDPETMVSAFVKGGSDDRSILLKQMADILRKQGPQGMNDFRFATFGKSMKEGQFDPMAFKKRFESLGENQRNVLFENNTELLQKIKDYMNLLDMNQRSLNAMANPNNGSTLRQMIPIMGGSTVGAISGGLPGAIAGIAAPVVIGKGLSPFTKYLSSEKVREGMLQRLLKEGLKKPKGK